VREQLVPRRSPAHCAGSTLATAQRSMHLQLSAPGGRDTRYVYVRSTPLPCTLCSQQTSHSTAQHRLASCNCRCQHKVCSTAYSHSQQLSARGVRDCLHSNCPLHAVLAAQQPQHSAACSCSCQQTSCWVHLHAVSMPSCGAVCCWVHLHSQSQQLSARGVTPLRDP
jgi:hypothetical protein